MMETKNSPKKSYQSLNNFQITSASSDVLKDVVKFLEILNTLPETSYVRNFADTWIEGVFNNEKVQNPYRAKDWKYLSEYVLGKLGLAEEIWAIPPVSVETFIEHPDYLDMGKETFGAVKKSCSDILSKGYLEACMVAGIGSGKSFEAEVLSAYKTQILLCMKNPHKRYELAMDKSIAIINMGVSQTQAKNVVFAGISSMIKASKFFYRFKPTIRKLEIEFEKQKILLICGNSKESTPLGLNVFCAVLDEAAFYTDIEGHDVAEEIYTTLQRRIVSRFGLEGLVVMISSPRYEQDFIMRKFKESRTARHIYAMQAPTWKMQDKYQLSDEYEQGKNCFYFDTNDSCIVEYDSILDKTQIDRLKDNEFPIMDSRYWEIPDTFLASFKANPEKAKRDFGAVPSLTLEGFFPIPAVIDNFWNRNRKNPFNGKAFNIDKPIPMKSYYIHIDLALNKKGTGDRAGFAMVHHNGFELCPNTGEELSYVYVDLVHAFEADAGGEVEFSKIRDFIYKLKDAGYKIQLVTYDGWNSIDSRQILRSRGITSDYLSVDKSIEPYQALKQLIQMKRLDCYYHPILDDELKHLELIKGTKVDHAVGSGKDASDALAGAVFNCLNDNARGVGLLN